MSLNVYLLFVLASALLVATPGPNVALIVGTSLRYGTRAGLTTVIGAGSGIVLQLTAVALGLSWIVDPVFARHFSTSSVTWVRPIWRSDCSIAGAAAGPGRRRSDAVARARACARLCRRLRQPQDSRVSRSLSAAISGAGRREHGHAVAACRHLCGVVDRGRHALGPSAPRAPVPPSPGKGAASPTGLRARSCSAARRCCWPPCVGGLLRARRLQDAHHFGIAAPARQSERRCAVAVGEVDVGAGLHQRLQGRGYDWATRRRRARWTRSARSSRDC